MHHDHDDDDYDWEKNKIQSMATNSQTIYKVIKKWRQQQQQQIDNIINIKIIVVVDIGKWLSSIKFCYGKRKQYIFSGCMYDGWCDHVHSFIKDFFLFIIGHSCKKNSLRVFWALLSCRSFFVWI